MNLKNKGTLSYKNELYLLVKLSAVCAEALLCDSTDMFSGIGMISVLAFICLLLTDYLLSRIWQHRAIPLICIGAELLLSLVVGAQICFPLILTLIFELADILDTGKYFYPVCGISAMLLILIYEPSQPLIAASAILALLGAFGRDTAEKLRESRETLDKLRDTVSDQSRKIKDLRSYVQTVRETTALEERSRFSARIHDKLGHGISGSIILLEGAQLSLESNPQQADKCLNTAIENLRSSVDSIRAALREERPKLNVTGAAELKEILERFSVTYDIKTELSIEGDESRIPPQIWNCIRENVTEAMTNTVKHSKATRFSMSIYVYNKLLRVEIADNGGCSGKIVKSIGLDAIEERTAACGGNCTFRGSPSGFRITSVFKNP